MIVGRVYAGFMVRERDKAKELGGSSEWTQESGPIQRQNKYVNVND